MQKPEKKEKIKIKQDKSHVFLFYAIYCVCIPF